MGSVALGKSRIIATDVVNKAVLEDMSINSEDYQEIICMQKNAQGEILAATLNTQKVNKLKSHLSILIQKKLCDLKDRKISIPLGTLIGPEILNSHGPCVPLTISLTGSVSVDFNSTCESTGINQTTYRVYLAVSTKITAILPGASSSENFNSQVLIAETFIIGNVPGYYGAVRTAY